MAVEFFSVSNDDINSRLKAAFNAARDGSGDLLFPDHEIPGTPGYNFRNFFLNQFLQHYRQLNTNLTAMSPLTAEGLGLDQWASFFDQPRKGSTSASGTVLITSLVTGQTLERLVGTRTLPSGTQLTNGPVTLRTTETVSIPLNEKQVSVSVDTLVPGASTEVAIGARMTIQLSGGLRDSLTAETITSISGGSNSETDQQLRFRLVRALTNPSTFDGLLVKLLSHTGVANVTLTNNRYGPGTVEAFVTPSQSFPPNTLRAELENLWEGFGRVYVLFPQLEGVVLKIRVNSEVDKQAVVDYINNLAVGETLILNAVESILQTSGSGDAQVIGIKRGLVDTNINIADPFSLKQISNLTLGSARNKWYTRPEWITLCEPE